MGSTKIPHDEFVRWILEVDETRLTDELISSFLKNLPQADVIQNVYKRKDEFDDMQEAEQFCVKVKFCNGGGGGKQGRSVVFVFNTHGTWNFLLVIIFDKTWCLH